MRVFKNTRRRLWMLAILAGVVCVFYAYLTRSAALRSRLAKGLGQINLRIESLDDISFSIFDGLAVQGLVVRAEREAETADIEAPPLVRLPSARMSIDPWPALLGGFRPREVLLNEPMVTLVWSDAERESESGEWGALPELSPPPTWTPRVRINNARLRVVSLEGGRYETKRVYSVSGEGGFKGGEGEEYVLRMFMTPGGGGVDYAAGQTAARVSWSGARLAAEFGRLDLAREQTLLPTTLARTCRQLQLKGEVRVSEAVLDGGGLSRVVLEGEDLGCLLPIEHGVDAAGGECFASLAEVRGTLTFDRGDDAGGAPLGLKGGVTARLEGRLNDAKTTVEMHVSDFAVATEDGEAGTGSEEDAFGRMRLGASRTSLAIEGLTLPNFEENAAFVTSERLPGPLRAWLRKYDAKGRVNLYFEIEDGGDSTEAQFEGRLETLDGGCCYAGFPYRVTDARGIVRFSNDGVVFEGLGGRHGSSLIRVDGRLLNTKSWTGFDLSFRGHNVASDADLYAALPEKYRAMWRRAAPVGLWDVEVRLHRDQGSEETGSAHTETQVDARLIAGSLRLNDDSLLENADGLLHLGGGRVALEDFYGYLDGALVCVNGELTPDDAEGGARQKLHIEAAGAKLTRSSAVHDREGRTVGEFKFDGRGDVWGQLNLGGDESGGHYAVRVTDGDLYGFDAEEPWSEARGWVTIEGDRRYEISGFSARREGGSLTIDGTAPQRMGVDQPARIDMAAEDVELERLLRQIVPGRWSNIREALGLHGAGRVAAHFKPSEGEGAETRQVADIELSAADMRPTPIPLALQDVTARMTLNADGFELHEANARRGETGVIQARGHGGWEEGRFWTDISVTGRDLTLDEELLSAVPPALGNLLRRLAPSGRLSLSLDQMLLNQPAADQVKVIGRVEIADAVLQIGLPLTDYSGQLNGKCEVTPGGAVSMDADFVVEKGLLAGRTIADWQGHITSGGDDRFIKVEDVQGALCGGRVIGFAQIDPDAQYELSFTLHDVSMDEFMQRKNDGRKTAGGRLDGHMFVRGDVKDAAQRSGGGEIRVRGASLLSSKVTASVAQASKRKKGDIGHEVDEALLRFVWEGDELKFTRMDIHSRDLRFIGFGSWNMRTDAVDMTLIGAPKEDAPRLFVLTDIIDSAREELMQYRVEGTAAEPRVTVEPLHNLTVPLRTLLGGE